jgi:LPXTG-motif cell wall-anchored protein
VAAPTTDPSGPTTTSGDDLPDDTASTSTTVGSQNVAQQVPSGGSGGSAPLAAPSDTLPQTGSRSELLALLGCISLALGLAFLTVARKRSATL